MARTVRPASIVTDNGSEVFRIQPLGDGFMVLTKVFHCGAWQCWAGELTRQELAALKAHIHNLLGRPPAPEAGGG